MKKYDLKIVDELYIGFIKDLHHMGEIDYIVSDGYDCAQTAICFLYQFLGRTVHEIYGKDKRGKTLSLNLRATVKQTGLLTTCAIDLSVINRLNT